MNSDITSWKGHWWMRDYPEDNWLLVLRNNKWEIWDVYLKNFERNSLMHDSVIKYLKDSYVKRGKNEERNRF